MLFSSKQLEYTLITTFCSCSSSCTCILIMLLLQFLLLLLLLVLLLFRFPISTPHQLLLLLLLLLLLQLLLLLLLLNDTSIRATCHSLESYQLQVTGFHCHKITVASCFLLLLPFSSRLLLLLFFVQLLPLPRGPGPSSSRRLLVTQCDYSMTQSQRTLYEHTKPCTQ